MPDLPLSHVHLRPVDDVPVRLEIACESGDFVVATKTPDGVLVSVDDAEGSLRNADGSPAVSTARLTNGEGRRLSCWLGRAL